MGGKREGMARRVAQAQAQLTGEASEDVARGLTHALVPRAVTHASQRQLTASERLQIRDPVLPKIRGISAFVDTTKTELSKHTADTPIQSISPLQRKLNAHKPQTFSYFTYVSAFLVSATHTRTRVPSPRRRGCP